MRITANFRSRTTIFLVITGAFLIISLFIAKSFIVKEKWITIAKGKDFTSLATFHYNANYHFQNLVNSVPTSGEVKSSTKIYTAKYRCHLRIEDMINIQEIRIGASYPMGYIFRINGTVATCSPNLIMEDTTNVLLISNHKEDQKKLGFYYLSKEAVKQGQNYLELEIIASDSLPSYSPEIFVEALKSGHFLQDFLKLRRHKNINLQKSELPVISINTLNNEIVDEPKVKSTLTTYKDNKPFTSNIKIEIKGKSSQSFGQLVLSYTFNTYDPNWQKEDINLLGLPEDSEWTLYAPFIDKSLIRNAIAYHISSQTGQYTPRFKFCDLYINEQYMGIYLLIEKPRISKNRINPYPDLKLKEVFLCEIDRPDSASQFGWFLNNVENNYIYVNVVGPKRKNLNEEKEKTVRKSVENLYRAFNDKVIDHHKIDSLVDINSLMDYMLINELAKNLDAFRLSFFFSKAEGKPFVIGPVWDFDLAFGNSNIGTFSNSSGWCNSSESICPFKMLNWGDVILNDPTYSKKLKEKWTLWRHTFLTNEKVMDIVNTYESQVAISEKNFHSSIPILDKWVWPNTYVGGTYENEIYYLKCWLLKRLYWIDKNLI